jgi:hypothetical protein
MKRYDFLQLSETEQQCFLLQFGNIFINYIQGETTVEFYKLKELFVKITRNSSGVRKVEAYHEIDEFSLFQIETEFA